MKREIAAIILVSMLSAVPVSASTVVIPANFPDSAVESSVSDGSSLTPQKFMDLKAGISYQDAASLLGSEGELSTSSEIAGTKTEMYSWTAPNGIGTVSLTFSNDSLTSKMQLYLFQTEAVATMEKFNQVKSGMTYDQVKQIFGCDGALESEMTMLGTVTDTYVWQGTELLSSANITFTNGSVTSVTQVGLK